MSSEIGVVQKLKKSKFAKNFKPRFCVLRDGHILVYDKASDAKPKEVIDLSTCSVKETSTEKNSFKVWGPCKEHEFNVESREAMIKWMDTITVGLGRVGKGREGKGRVGQGREQ